MRTISFLKLVSLLLLQLATTQTSGQQLASCGDMRIDTAALHKAKQFELMNGRVLAVNFLIRVYFHIGAYSDGTNQVITPQLLRQEFDTLRADYAGAGICFLFAGYDIMNNSNLDTNFNANTDNSNLFDPYRIPGCINVFYVQKIKGTNAACANNCGIGGSSLAIPNTMLLISQGNIGPGRTISHEVGHCMGLLHTFEKNAGGFENIDGSNSSTAGDQITDTPADPYTFNGTPCFNTTGCIYSGNCTDPNGETNYIPPYSNLMSYWVNVVGRPCIPILFLTPNQYSRVNGFLSTYPPLLACGSPADLAINTNFSISTGYFFWSATNSIVSNVNVNINGTAKCALGAPSITLHPGFHANSSAGGRTVISAKICD